MSQPLPHPPARRGRPPDPDVRARALSAAHDILMTEGFGRVTVEAVAARSGVSKPTLYRHWTNAQDLALAALTETATDAAIPAGTAARAALTAHLAALITAFATTRGRQIAQALAAADPQSEFARVFRNRVILQSREAGRALLARAVAANELAPPPDVEALLDMIYGPLFYRLLVGHRPLDTALATAITDIAFAALPPIAGPSPAR